MRLRLFAFVSLVASAAALWPHPTTYTRGTGGRRLAKSFSVDLQPQAFAKDDALVAASQRLLARVNNVATEAFVEDRGASRAETVRQSIPIQHVSIVIGSGSPETGNKTSDIHYDPRVSPFAFQHGHGQKAISGHTGIHRRGSSGTTTQGNLMQQAIAPLEDHDEQYTLEITEEGDTVTVHASTALGALRGMSTFTQLVYRLPSIESGSNDQALNYVWHTPLHIEDKAAFPYRGIMLDTSRHFISVEQLKSQIDVMELIKLNQLHWHMTDAQSWPLELNDGGEDGLEVLAKRGAYRPDLTYSKAQIKDVVQYAAERGVNVILEIDMPGHMNAGVKDMPGELITCESKLPWEDWAAEPPSGHLDIRKEEAKTFVKAVFDDALTSFPGPYVSTGNDEVKPQCFGLAKDDKAGTDKLLAPFVQATHAHLSQKHKKIPMVWEEAVLDFPDTGRGLLQDTLVEAWTSSENVHKLLANEKIRLVHAPSNFFYLDCGMGGWSGVTPTASSWCPYVTWQKMYSFDPLNGTQGIAESEKRVMGGEAALWSEQVDETNLEPLLWPRAAAGAEVFWTGAQKDLNGVKGPKEIKEATARMNELRARLVEMGIRAAPIQPDWCVYRPGACFDQPQVD